jgi:hypothetical protein
MDDLLTEQGRILEEMFFRKHEVEVRERIRRIEQAEQDRGRLAQVSGIHDFRVLDKLLSLGVSADMLSSLAVVPLVEVAWADGKLDEAERVAVLAGAEAIGIDRESIDFALLDVSLAHRPPEDLLAVWIQYVRGLCATLSEAQRRALKADLIGRARQVAEASGGFLGLGKVSSEERAVLAKMETAFF